MTATQKNGDFLNFAKAKHETSQKKRNKTNQRTNAKAKLEYLLSVRKFF